MQLVKKKNGNNITIRYDSGNNDDSSVIINVYDALIASNSDFKNSNINLRINKDILEIVNGELINYVSDTIDGKIIIDIDKDGTYHAFMGILGEGYCEVADLLGDTVYNTTLSNNDVHRFIDWSRDFVAYINGYILENKHTRG